jgi:hypothetical protein
MTTTDLIPDDPLTHKLLARVLAEMIRDDFIRMKNEATDVSETGEHNAPATGDARPKGTGAQVEVNHDDR